MKQAKYEIDTDVVYNDEPVTIKDNARGWYTIETTAGDVVKVRAAKLSLPDVEDEAEERTMKDQMAKARKGYAQTKTYAGERSYDNGDQLAQLLRGLEPRDVCLLADVLYDEAEGHFSGRYGHLNAGQQRMNSGNKIRSGVKRDLFTVEAVQEAFKGLSLTPMYQEG